MNLASRCQTAGKISKIKDLGIQDLGKEEDRILCTVVSDMATHDANSQIADGGSQLKVDTRIIQQARCNIGAYKRHIVEDVPLQGIGNTTLAVTFITQQTAIRKSQQLEEEIL